MDEDSVRKREALEAWQKELADEFVSNVLYFRDLRGLSNDQLRERLDELGWRLTKDSLASILSKKRKSVPVGDVMLFAWALNVPPIALVFSTVTNRPVRTAPVYRADLPSAVVKTPATSAAGWFAGTKEIASPVDLPDVIDDYWEIADLVSRIDEIDNAMRLFSSLNAALLVGSYANEDERKSLIERAKEQLEEASSFRRFLRSTRPEMELPDLRNGVKFLDDTKFQMPSLPLIGYNTEHEIEFANRFRSQDAVGPNRAEVK